MFGKDLLLMSEFAFMSASELSSKIEAGSLDPRDLTRTCLDRATGPGRALNAFVTICEDSAVAQAAQAAERASSRQRLGPLDGIPIAVKDNMDVAGVPTSNGFGGGPWRVPTEDSELVRRLRAAGAVILGKLNMEEGALGPTSNNPHVGRVENPHRLGHTPGGSSGGSGAAVAAGLCCAAMGSDTGGSIRIPASYCGTVGLKPSYGLVSTRGVVPLSYSLDHVGPLTRTVEDAALMLTAMAGFDPACTESRKGPTSGFVPARGKRLDGVTIGVLGGFEIETHDAAIAPAFAAALDQLKRLGAAIRPVKLPTYDPVKGRRAGFVRVEAEAAFVHADLYAREPERFSKLMRYYLDYGARLLATKLLQADRRMEAAAFELTQCLETVDAIVSPTTPHAAPAFGDNMPDDAGTYCIIANFAGVPAISVPMGRDDAGLPLGLQFIGARHQDARVLSFAAAYEAAAGHTLRPPVPFGPAH
jgi:aspartyl-tRNA(Asn)/glutamyl-tRNA(Gln) amidotransferase subunit A